MKTLQSYIVVKEAKAEKEITVNVKSSSLRKNAAAERKIRFDTKLVNTLDRNLNDAAKDKYKEARRQAQRNLRRLKRQNK